MSEFEVNYEWEWHTTQDEYHLRSIHASLPPLLITVMTECLHFSTMITFKSFESNKFKTEEGTG